MTTSSVTFILNGKKITPKVSLELTLADFLHEELGLSGTKVCCGIGLCKACTVAVKPKGASNLNRTQACITPVSTLDGTEVITVEGLSRGDKLHPLQEAFLKHFSFQCGYSSAGFLMGALILLDQLKVSPVPFHQVDEAISQSLGEHVCRCTGYAQYYAAIKEVIQNTQGLIKA